MQRWSKGPSVPLDSRIEAFSLSSLGSNFATALSSCSRFLLVEKKKPWFTKKKVQVSAPKA
jgi:hypothetical protein